MKASGVYSYGESAGTVCLAKSAGIFVTTRLTLLCILFLAFHCSFKNLQYLIVKMHLVNLLSVTIALASLGSAACIRDDNAVQAAETKYLFILFVYQIYQLEKNPPLTRDVADMQTVVIRTRGPTSTSRAQSPPPRIPSATRHGPEQLHREERIGLPIPSQTGSPVNTITTRSPLTLPLAAPS